MSNNNFPPRNTRNSQRAKDDSTSIPRDRSRARTDSRGENVIHEHPGANSNSNIATACPIPGTPTDSRSSDFRAGSCADSWENPGTPSLLLSTFDPNQTVQANTNISVNSATQSTLSTHRSRSQDGSEHLETELQGFPDSTESRKPDVRDNVPPPMQFQPHYIGKDGRTRDIDTTSDSHKSQSSVRGKEKRKTESLTTNSSCSIQFQRQESEISVKELDQKAEKTFPKKEYEQAESLRILTKHLKLLDHGARVCDEKYENMGNSSMQWFKAWRGIDLPTPLSTTGQNSCSTASSSKTGNSSFLKGDTR
ncbi:hypothetical protein PPACK8108_LOCUS6621 [Phakopsora pachyrhizi]|uniref:Uncharacterized protein n=1 Tax=Phakopsora pachyrhizi TaxID=170000 RepID=A0AAV0AU33_PHAPC|nr:hypothetical protein PPACK8108_LOCUS6621 [Phakopsora pachyrhizi]